MNIVCDQDTLFDLEKIAIKSFAPLTGFMTQEELDSCLYSMHLPDGSPWTIPILLQVDKEIYERTEIGEKVNLQDESGEIYGTVEVKDKYPLNKKELVKLTFGTDDERHPGVSLFIEKGDYALGGPVKLIKPPPHPFRTHEYTPEETRAIFRDRDWKTVTGFQTRNAPHRAHEYLQRVALEITDGLFVHPILGRKKGGDFSNDTILRAYESLIKNYYPGERVLLSGLSTPMRYAGPREAVFHALVRKNYGCTHFIVGRDHAGVGDYYDPYAAHHIFESFQDLGIEIIKVHNIFFCKLCDSMASPRTCSHPDEYHQNISMTRIRDMVKRGENAPLTMVRKEVFGALKEDTQC